MSVVRSPISLAPDLIFLLSSWRLGLALKSGFPPGPIPVGAGFCTEPVQNSNFLTQEFRAIDAKYPVRMGTQIKNCGMQIAMFRVGVREVGHTPVGYCL